MAKNWKRFHKIRINKKTRNIGVCLGAHLLPKEAEGDIEILKYGSPPKTLLEIGWAQVFLINQTMT